MSNKHQLLWPVDPTLHVLLKGGETRTEVKTVDRAASPPFFAHTQGSIQEPNFFPQSQSGHTSVATDSPLCTLSPRTFTLQDPENGVHSRTPDGKGDKQRGLPVVTKLSHPVQEKFDSTGDRSALLTDSS